MRRCEKKKKNIPNLSSMKFWGASLKTWILWYATLESYSILRKNGHTSKTSSWFTMLHRAVTYGPLPGWDTFLTSLWFSFRWAKSAKHLHFDALGNDLLLGAIQYRFAFFWCISCIFNPSLLYKLFFFQALTIADMETHSKINTLNTPWVHLKRVPPMHRKNLSFWNSPNLSISVSVDERYGEFSQFLPKKVPNI